MAQEEQGVTMSRKVLNLCWDEQDNTPAEDWKLWKNANLRITELRIQDKNQKQQESVKEDGSQME